MPYNINNTSDLFSCEFDSKNIFGYEGGYYNTDDGIAIKQSVNLTESFEDSNYNFLFNGTPFTRTIKSTDKGDIACGYIGTTNPSSTIDCTTEIEAANDNAYIEFDYLASSELSYDWCRFFIDDVEKLKKSGPYTNYFTKVRYNLTKGKHTLKWQYKNDSSGNKGDSKFYVTNIVFDSGANTFNPKMVVISNPIDFSNFTSDMKLHLNYNHENTNTDYKLIASYDFWESYITVQDGYKCSALVGKEDVMFAIVYTRNSEDANICFHSLNITTSISGEDEMEPVQQNILVDTKRSSYLKPTIIDLDVNDAASRNQFQLLNHNVVTHSGRYGMTFKEDSYAELGGDSCYDEWSKFNIEYTSPVEPWECEAMYTGDEYDWNLSLFMQRNSHYMAALSFTTNFSSYGADSLELCVDIRIPDYINPWDNIIDVYQNGSWIAEMRYNGWGGYENNIIPLPNGVGWNDTFSFVYKNTNMEHDSAELYLRNISFKESYWGTNEFEARKSTPIKTDIIKAGNFSVILDESNTTLGLSGEITRLLRLSTNSNMSNPIDIPIQDKSSSYDTPYDLPQDEMYASIVYKRKWGSERTTLHKFKVSSTETIEPPKENVPVKITLDTQRGLAKDISITSDTKREVSDGYSLKIDYDYLVDYPDKFKLNSMVVDRDNKTFSFQTYSEEVAAHHDMTSADSAYNISYYNVFYYDEEKPFKDATDFTYAREYDRGTGDYIQYGAMFLPEMHKVAGMMIVSGLNPTKSAEMTFKVKVATVGDLEQGEADFVLVATDTTTETPQMINCTNNYQDVTVSISSGDIWDDGTARVHFQYNNFHLGNFVDVELRLAHVQVTQTSAHGLNLVMQSAKKMSTRQFKKIGVDINIDAEMSDKVKAYIGFSNNPLWNVYDSDLVIFGRTRLGEDTRAIKHNMIDYDLLDGVALDKNCPDEAYLTIVFERPADLSQYINLKSIELVESDEYKAVVKKEFEGTRAITKDSSISNDSNRRIGVENNLISDTQRDIVANRWISAHAYGTTSMNGVVEVTGQHTNGMTLVPEAITEYKLNPSNYDFTVSKAKIRVHRSLDGRYFHENYENLATSEYIKIEYSVDGKQTYHDLVANPDNSIAEIEVPRGIKSIFFKYSAKVNNKCNLTIQAYVEALSIFDERIQFYAAINNAINDNYDTVIIGSRTYRRHTIYFEGFYGMKSSLPQVADLYIDFGGYNSQIKLGLATSANGDILVDGKEAVWTDMDFNAVDVYIRTDSKEKIKAIYMTTFREREVNIVADTWRKASGKVLDFNFATRRRVHKAVNPASDSLRLSHRKQKSGFITKRTVFKSDNKGIDLKRTVTKGVKSNIESIRRTVLDKVLDIMTKRTVIRSAKVIGDTSRLINANHLEVFNDTKRTVISEDVVRNKTKRQISVNKEFECESNRKLVKNIAVKSKTRRSLVKKANDSIKTIRKAIKNANMISDSKRRIAKETGAAVKTKRSVIYALVLPVDTVRRIRMIFNTAVSIAVEVKRMVIKEASSLSDTDRFIGYIFNSLLDTTRKAVNNNKNTVSTERKVIKDINALGDTTKSVIKDIETSSDTNRSVYWRIYSKTNYDLLRQGVKTGNADFITKRSVVVRDIEGYDTLRDTFFQTEVNVGMDLERRLLINKEFECDTDRLPFYFVNKQYEAKRSHVYHKKAFMFDTARDKYVVDMTRVYYDTLRAVKVINPHAKVYEYNIKICNTLEFDIKM